MSLIAKQFFLDYILQKCPSENVLVHGSNHVFLISSVEPWGLIPDSSFVCCFVNYYLRDGVSFSESEISALVIIYGIRSLILNVILGL
jgi:hypothetical protein